MSNVSADAALEEYRSVGELIRRDVDGLGIECWYLESGPQTILFLHGNLAGKEVFYRQFEALTDSGYSLLALDLPGHGGSSDSSNPERDYSIPALALTIRRLLEDLGIERPLVVGWSLGGHIAIEMAGRGFDLAGLMIFGTPPMGPGGTEFERAFVPSEAMQVTLKAERTPLDLAVYLRGLYGRLECVPEAFVALARRADGRCPACIGAHWSSGTEGCHQRTVVLGWERPVCMVHGDEDVFVSRDYLHSLPASGFWLKSLIVLPDVGHAPFLEATETFNGTLASFARCAFEERP